MKYQVILASGSPRRKELLELIGVEFKVITSNKEEVITSTNPEEVVKELFADRFTIDNIAGELESILPGGNRRETILNGYKDVCQRLGDTSAPDNAARQIVCLLKGVKD